MRPPAFVPESLSAGEALKQTQSSRVHFAFVLNEHGGIEGILTLEDLLEEIVGEISDEYDQEAKEQIVADQGSYVLDGMLAVRNANQRLGLELPEDEGYTTIAGFLMAEVGKCCARSNTTEPFSESSAWTGGAFGEFASLRRLLRVSLNGPWSL